MSDDISSLLSDWPYEDQEDIQVRRITGDDDRPRLQVRVDLGVMQLELTGRPDGSRPHGCESLLEYHQNQAQEHRRVSGWYEGYDLGPAECAALRRESLQYYHRRIACMAVQDYTQAMADADHNLQILDLLKAFARHQEDWLAVEQYRAFITCHRIQCMAFQHLVHQDTRAALLEIERGLRQVREIYVEHDNLEGYDESSEREFLEDLRRKFEGQYQITHRQQLLMRLDAALQREDPDEVAELRAELRELDNLD